MQVIDTGVQLGPYAIYYQPLQFSSLDPLFSDVRMNTQQFRVQINAATQNPAYSNYVGTYAFQVRAVPIADFGVFNPGTQTETITLGNHGRRLRWDHPSNERLGLRRPPAGILPSGIRVLRTPEHRRRRANCGRPKHPPVQAIRGFQVGQRPLLGVRNFPGQVRQPAGNLCLFQRSLHPLRHDV